jgi:hypothetical protein
MKPMPILADSRRRSQCRTCGAAIEFATHAITHAVMPFNAPIVLEGSALAFDDRPAAVVRVDMAKTTSHFTSCPQREAWRARAKGRR